MDMSKVTEWCQNCGSEVSIESEMKLQECPYCGKYIVPCTMCNHDTCNCDLCEIGNLCEKLNKQ